MRAAGEVDAAGLELHDEQQIEGDQAAFRPDFHRREVDGRQHVPVGLDEGRPRRLSLSLTCRFDAVLFQDVTDGLVGDLVAEVGQRSLDAIVTPGRILACHAEHQLDDFLGHGRTADRLALVAVVPFLSDEHPMPAEDRVRREERADFLQSLASEHFPFDGQSSPLIVVEQDAFRTVQFLEHGVLRTQVIDCLLLLAVDPAGEDREEELPRLEDEVHGAGPSTRVEITSIGGHHGSVNRCPATYSPCTSRSATFAA